jgi:hypothetical protein
LVHNDDVRCLCLVHNDDVRCLCLVQGARTRWCWSVMVCVFKTSSSTPST